MQDPRYRSSRSDLGRRRRKRSYSGPSNWLLIGLFLMAALMVVGLIPLGLKLFPGAYGPDNGGMTPPVFPSPISDHYEGIRLSAQLLAPCHSADGKAVEPIGVKHGDSMEAIYSLTIKSPKVITVSAADYDFEAFSASETLKGPPTCDSSDILPRHYWRLQWKGSGLSTSTRITPQSPLTASPGQPAMISLMVIVDHKLIVEGSTVTVTVAVNGATVQLEAALPGKLYAYPWPGEQDNP